MRHRVRQIEKERLSLIAFDERDRPLRVDGREPRLIVGRDVGIDDVIPFDQRQWRVRAWLRARVMRPHVVGIGEPQIFIEPVVDRKVAFEMPQVPLASHTRGVSTRFEDLGDRRFAFGKSGFRLGPQGAVDPDSIGIAARQQRRPRCRADRLSHVKIGESPSLPCEAIEVRRVETRGAKASYVAVSLIVGK